MAEHTNGKGAPLEPQRATPQRAAPTDLVALRREIQGLPANKRLDAILSRPDVIRVVQRMPVQDLFTTVKEVGVQDSLELLELLHPRQVQGFIDLDAWRGDRLDPVALGDWLEALYTASPQRAVKQIVGLDVELLSLLFKMHTQVYDLTVDEQPETDPKYHSVTPDHRYLIVYDPEHENLALALMQTVDRMFGTDPSFVLRLVEAVRWELPSALEDECYRWRNGRLADLGFVPLEEAGEIFAYVDPDKAALSGAALEPPPEVVPADEEDAPQDLSTSVLLPEGLLSEGGHVLGAALAMSDDEQRRRVSHELVLVANRLHTATGGDAGDVDALKATARRAADTIGIGLSYLAKGDPAGLKDPLERVPCLRLFQIGHSVTLRLGRQLRTQLQSAEGGLKGEGMLRLDHPLREAVAGVLRAQPLFYAGLTDERRSDFIPFRSLADVAEAAKAVSEAAFRAALVGGKGLSADDAALEQLGVTNARTGPSHGALLATWLARAALFEDASFAPLDDDELSALAQRVVVDGAPRLPEAERALAALEEVARNKAPFPGAKTPDEAAARARAYGELVLRALEEELASVSGAVDGRFVHAGFTTASLALQGDSHDEAASDDDVSNSDEERNG